MRWMDEAWSQVGVHETAGPAATPEIVRYFADAGRPEVTSDETAWCAAFVGAMLSRGGVELEGVIPKHERLLARSYLKLGTPIDEPRVGCVAVVYRNAERTLFHVTFVAGVTPTHIQGLGGNQADAVSVKAFPRSAIAGLRWPAAPATAAELAKTSRISAAAQRQVADATRAGTAQATQPFVPAAPPKLGLSEITAKAEGAKGFVQMAESFIGFVGAKWGWVVGVGAAYFVARMLWDAWSIRQARAEDHNTGKTAAAPPAPDPEADRETGPVPVV